MCSDRVLTLGMATYDDFDGVYFTIQSVRLYHPEVVDQLEFVVLDNHPQSEQGHAVADFIKKYVPHARYVPYTGKTSTPTRNRLFDSVGTPYVLAMDCHVLLEAGSLQRLIEYYQRHPKTADLVHGPLVHESMIPDNVATHMEPKWNDKMFGQWATDPRGRDPDAPPFEIPMHDLGLFSCRSDAWLGSHDRFCGFGGEEGYIHEKFRREGRRILCLPSLRWLHRFGRSGGPSYPSNLHERVHNYLVGWLDLGWDPTPILDYFQQWGGRARWEELLSCVRGSDTAAPAAGAVPDMHRVLIRSTSTSDRTECRPTGTAANSGQSAADDAQNAPADGTPVAPSELLWRDTELFDACYEKSATALVAVEQTLARHRPLGGREQEFLDLYACVAATDPEEFTEVWSSPVAYFWTRVVYQLVKCCVTNDLVPPVTQRYVDAIAADGPHEALLWHLGQFKMFALSLALRRKENWLFESPWEPLLPAAIPGTPWSLSGDSQISINGIEDGQLRVTDGSGTFLVPLDETSTFSSSRITRHRCPKIDYDDCQLFAQPHAFHIPGLSETQGVLQAGVEFQHHQQQRICETLAIIQRYDRETFGQFRQVMSLVALKRPDSAGISNTSFSRLPGALTATATQNTLALAEDFIHEFYHNRLFFIAEQGSFFEEDGGKSITDTRFYSPWRCDQRPLYGIWHALYVFTAVGRYWLSVYRDPPHDTASRQYAVERLIRIPHQLAMAVHVLVCHARFSLFGQKLFEDLAHQVAVLRDQVDAAVVPSDAPALVADSDGGYSEQRSEIDQRTLSVCESLREHCQLYDIDGQCRELVDAFSGETVHVRSIDVD